MAKLPGNVLAPASARGHYNIYDGLGRVWYGSKFGKQWQAWPGTNHPARAMGLTMENSTLTQLAENVKAYVPNNGPSEGF
jgi:hypothetical protein